MSMLTDKADKHAKSEVFRLLEDRLLRNNRSKGRPGMDLWQILVLGVVRLTLDLNYDRLHHVANYDSLATLVSSIAVCVVAF